MQLHLNYLSRSKFHLHGNISDSPEQHRTKSAKILKVVFHVTNPYSFNFQREKMKMNYFLSKLVLTFSCDNSAWRSMLCKSVSLLSLYLRSYWVLEILKHYPSFYYRKNKNSSKLLKLNYMMSKLIKEHRVYFCSIPT